MSAGFSSYYLPFSYPVFCRQN